MSEALDAPDDLNADLAAAFAADAGSAPPETPPVAAPAAPESGQPRASDGKFAPKEAVSGAQTIPTPEPTQALAPEAQAEPIRPPASWSAQAKADFATLPAHIQAEVLKREGDVSKGFQEKADQLKRFEPLEQVFAPIRAKLAAAGVSEAQYVQNLSAADEALSGPNKLQAIAQIAQQYGIDLRQFSQPGQAPQQFPQGAQLPPEVQAALDRINTFEQSQTQQQTAQIEAEVADFAKDHLYFENVRPAMAALMRSGDAATMDEAYDMACWARPDIRPLVQREQQAKTEQAARDAAGAKVANARGGAVSVTGSPAAGAIAPSQGPAPTIEEELRRAMTAGSA